MTLVVLNVQIPQCVEIIGKSPILERLAAILKGLPRINSTKMKFLNSTENDIVCVLATIIFILIIIISLFWLSRPPETVGKEYWMSANYIQLYNAVVKDTLLPLAVGLSGIKVVHNFVLRKWS